VVQAFLNSYYDLTPGRHGAEVLASPAALGRWLSDEGLISGAIRLRDEDLDRTLALRAALRDLLAANPNGGGEAANANGDSEVATVFDRLNHIAGGAGVEVRLQASGPRFVGHDESSIAGTIGVLLAIVATAMIDGSWGRMKLCPGRDCGWAFYDHSRNQGGRWCSMSVCGGREKARAHYRRRRGDDEG
jgi:predicted RNA-binding Zn ribbon-like protein